MWLDKIHRDWEFSGPSREGIIESSRTDKDMQRLVSSLPRLSESQQRYLLELKDLRDRILTGNVELLKKKGGSMKSFSIKAGSTTNVDVEDSGRIKAVFVRDLADNTLFPEIQVSDISSVTDSNTRWKLDGDGIVWKACSSVETLYIIAKHIETGLEVELDGVTQFKGLGKNISTSSWMGVENIKREVQGLPLYSPEDFEVTQHNRLNYKTEDKAFEQVQIMIRTKLKNIREQFQINNIDFCIGEGECFRDRLDLSESYKGKRSPLRPIVLKRARKWVLEVLKGELAPEDFENDDYVEWYGNIGWNDYKKTGIFSYGCIAEDKDSLSNPKLLINFGTHAGKDNPKKGQFKFPKAWLIKDASFGAGGLDLVVKSKKELKGYGLLWLIAQAFLIGDTADCYNAIKHLPPKLKEGIKYADVAAYKDFYHITDPKEALQKVVDFYLEILPYGVQYTNHKEEDLDVDTMTYMNTYFLVAYMTRSSEDKMDFYKLCKALKVDTSKIVGNNKQTVPERVYVGHQAYTEALKEELDTLVTAKLKSYKSLKKDALVSLLDYVKGSLSSIDFDQFYEMQQKDKI